MRILALVDGTRAERRSYAAALGRLAARGHDVTLAVRPDVHAAEADIPGVRLVRLPAPPESSLPTFEAARDVASRMGVAQAASRLAPGAGALLLDVASGICAMAALADVPRKVALRLDSYEELVSVREPSLADVDRARYFYHGFITEFSEEACHATLVPFRASAQGGRSVRPGEAIVLPPGVDPAGPSRAGAAPRAPAGLGRPLVAAVGPWLPAFGFDILVRAFLRIREVHPSATLVTAGETTLIWYPRREFRLVVLDRIARDARDWITFVDDDRSAIREVLSAADVLLHPTFVPGTGTAILEAFAAGVPVVASALPAYREWIEPGREALLVPPGDVAALADAALAVLGDAALAGDLARRGDALVRERFTLDRLADGLEAALESSAAESVTTPAG